MSEEGNYKTYSPDKLPGPVIKHEGQSPLTPGIANTDILPIAEKAVANIHAYNKQQDWPYEFMREMKDLAFREGGFKPTTEQALTYASECMVSAYPDRKIMPTDSVENVIAMVNASNMQDTLQELKAGKISSDTAGVVAEMETDRMRKSYERYLQEMVYMICFMESDGNKNFAQEISQPASLQGSDIELHFLHKMGKTALTESDRKIMALLGVYRGFILSHELVMAAKQERPVNKDLVKQLWEANNVRKAVVSTTKDR